MNDSAGISSGQLQSIVAGPDPEQTVSQIFDDSHISDVVVYSSKPCALSGTSSGQSAPRSEEYASEFRNNADGSVSLVAQTLVSKDAVHDLLDGNTPNHSILLLGQEEQLPTRAGQSTQDLPLALITLPSEGADRALVFDLSHGNEDGSRADEWKHQWGEYRAAVPEVEISQISTDTLARSGGGLPEDAHPNGRDTEADAVWVGRAFSQERVGPAVPGNADANLDDPTAKPTGAAEVDFSQEGPVSAFSATPDLALSPPQVDLIPVGEKSLAVVAAFLTGHARRPAEPGTAPETRAEGTPRPVPVGLGAGGSGGQDGPGDVREARREKDATGRADEDPGQRVGPLPAQIRSPGSVCRPAAEQTSASQDREELATEPGTTPIEGQTAESNLPAPGLLQDWLGQEGAGPRSTAELLLEIVVLGALPRVALSDKDRRAGQAESRGCATGRKGIGSQG